MSPVSIPPPQCLQKRLFVPHRYMFGPGPSNVPSRILLAGAQPVIGHMHPETFEIMSDIKSGIQYLFQTNNRTTLAVSGTGHTAMECAIFNTVEPGESVLVAVNGIWGERAADMAERIGARVNTIVASPGSYLTNAEIERVLLHIIESIRLIQTKPHDATAHAVIALSCHRLYHNTDRFSSSSHTESLPQESCILWTASASCATSKTCWTHLQLVPHAGHEEFSDACWFVSPGITACFSSTLWPQWEEPLSTWTSKV
uniref:Alanine--glyoxylate and serine--pyruvate aminotransferase a n=1 Tax=Fundulus heteroclitus TaxID=8078 RepID=A0A3Q2QG70_FUNHE